MEFDIVDTRLHCEVEDRCASSTLSNCDVGSSSSRRGGLYLVIRIRLQILSGDGLALILEPIEIAAAALFITALESEMVAKVAGKLLMPHSDSL